MAEVIWAEPALHALDGIADYIARDNPEAARRLVQKIFEHVDHFERQPRLGSKPEELKGWRYRRSSSSSALDLAGLKYRGRLNFGIAVNKL